MGRGHGQSDVWSGFVNVTAAAFAGELAVISAIK